MPYKNEPVPAYVLEVLRDGVEIDGDRLRIVQKLERTLYEAVNKTLERIGGRWNRKAKAHLFEDGNPRDLLNFVLATGMIPPKNPTAYYPASEELAARIARYIPATARRVLEPSAGTGSIARAIREYCHRQHIPAALDCCEILPKFQEQLQAQGFNVIWSDFLTYRPSSIYDAILMNPPYALESDRLAYITHIEHAWSLLAPGGVLVAVAPAGFAHNIERRVKALRDLIATCGYWEDLPDGTFREAGTMVRTVLLVAHKPRPVQGDDHAPQCQEIPIVSEAESISASQDPETGAAQGEASPAPFDMSAPTGTQDPASQQESAERPAQEAQKPAPAERKRARETHTVMLGWQSYGVTVGAETYQHILSLLKEQAVCRRCQCCYTANSPQVAGNLCLDCFLRREGRQHGLSYVGKAKTHEADPWTTHLYLDPRNRIYTSTAGPGKAEEAQEDAFETLRYWKFPIPEHATINGKTVDVHKGTQSIYGDVTGDIIAIRCTNRHEDTDITFFASKSGMLRQINMRKPAHRKLFAEAKRRLEIQKRTRHFYESEVCETIIEMLCGNPALWP